VTGRYVVLVPYVVVVPLPYAVTEPPEPNAVAVPDECDVVDEGNVSGTDDVTEPVYRGSTMTTMSAPRAFACATAFDSGSDVPLLKDETPIDE
jgi:hypothetical protein